MHRICRALPWAEDAANPKQSRSKVCHQFHVVCKSNQGWDLNICTLLDMCNLKHIHTSIPAPFVALPPATPVMWHAKTETQTVVVVLCRSPSPSQPERAVEMLSLLRCVSAWQNKTHLLGPRTYYYCHASAGCLSDVLTKPHSQDPEPLLAGDIQHIDQADGEAKRRDNSRPFGPWRWWWCLPRDLSG